jgi:hypothetical protein
MPCVTFQNASPSGSSRHQALRFEELRWIREHPFRDPGPGCPGVPWQITQFCLYFCATASRRTSFRAAAASSSDGAVDAVGSGVHEPQCVGVLCTSATARNPDSGGVRRQAAVDVLPSTTQPLGRTIQRGRGSLCRSPAIPGGAKYLMSLQFHSTSKLKRNSRGVNSWEYQVE